MNYYAMQKQEWHKDLAKQKPFSFYVSFQLLIISFNHYFGVRVTYRKNACEKENEVPSSK